MLCDNPDSIFILEYIQIIKEVGMVEVPHSQKLICKLIESFQHLTGDFDLIYLRQGSGIVETRYCSMNCVGRVTEMMT